MELLFISDVIEIVKCCGVHDKDYVINVSPLYDSSSFRIMVYLDNVLINYCPFCGKKIQIMGGIIK